MNETIICYIGMKPCGCAVTATVDKPEWKKETAESLAEWVKDGLTIERRTVEEARAILRRCRHKYRIEKLLQSKALQERLDVLRK